MTGLATEGPSVHLTQNWDVRKQGSTGPQGVVVSQSYEATNAGVAILNVGGSAADAAVATVLVLAVVEPWNSGLGGIGYAVVAEPGGTAWALDFGPRSPRNVNPDDYPLSGETSAEIFGWPRVKGDRNVHGPLSFCVPSAVAGLGRLHERFGRLPWAKVVAPAIACARRGLAKDWFATVKIAQMAHLLRLYDESARIYLPNGLPPVGREKGNPSFLPQGGLADTLELLAAEGWRGFYTGEIATRLLDDFKNAGSPIDDIDLSRVDASFSPAESIAWGGNSIFLPSADSAAEMLRQVLTDLPYPQHRDAYWFSTLARSMMEASKARLEKVSAGSDAARQTCTTHLNVCDGAGLTISFTTTLLGLMGSAFVLPKTGILMNNGMMWFDPDPGKSNAIGSGTRPKSNMLPIICRTAKDEILSLGASGGRRILPAVLSCMADLTAFSKTPEEAAHLPRIDVSATDQIVVDRRMGNDIVAALEKLGDVTLCEHAAAPLNFGCPSILHQSNGIATGQPDVMTPGSAAAAASFRA